MIIIIFSFSIFLHCATVSVRHINFSSNNVNNIYEGMSPFDVEELFGQPDISFETIVGKNTDNPCKVIVYKYQMSKDPEYEYIKRFLTNTFIFNMEIKTPKLQHWEIEYYHD